MSGPRAVGWGQGCVRVQLQREPALWEGGHFVLPWGYFPSLHCSSQPFPVHTGLTEVCLFSLSYEDLKHSLKGQGQ